MLVTLPTKYVEIKDIIKVSKLGAFHAVRLETQKNSDVVGPYPVDSSKWYQNALEQMKSDYRNARYKNYFTKIFYWILTFSAPFIGTWLGGNIGLFIGILIILIRVLLSNYATGKKAGI